MKVWPFGAALRGEVSNRLMLRWLKTVVVSDEEKAWITVSGEGEASADGDPAVAPGAGEPYPAALVVEVAEAVGGARGGLHGAVGGLGAGVGDAVGEEAEPLGPPVLDRAGQALELGQLRVGAPGVEPVQPGRDLVPVSAAAGAGEQRSQLLFRDPGGEDLAGRIGVDQLVPHPGELVGPEPFPPAQ